jgi:hypothetical protein
MTRLLTAHPELPGSPYGRHNSSRPANPTPVPSAAAATESALTPGALLPGQVSGSGSSVGLVADAGLPTTAPLPGCHRLNRRPSRSPRRGQQLRTPTLRAGSRPHGARRGQPPRARPALHGGRFLARPQRQPRPARALLPPRPLPPAPAGRVDQGLGDGRDPAKADGGRPPDERGKSGGRTARPRGDVLRQGKQVRGKLRMLVGRRAATNLAEGGTGVFGVLGVGFSA